MYVSPTKLPDTDSDWTADSVWIFGMALRSVILARRMYWCSTSTTLPARNWAAILADRLLVMQGEVGLDRCLLMGKDY